MLSGFLGAIVGVRFVFFIQFGLGFRISDRGDNGSDYGWGGAAGTRFWSNPEKNLSVLFMVQIKPTPQQFGERILNLTYQAMKE